jgi:hypothetical protein
MLQSGRCDQLDPLLLQCGAGRERRHGPRRDARSFCAWQVQCADPGTSSRPRDRPSARLRDANLWRQPGERGIGYSFRYRICAERNTRKQIVSQPPRLVTRHPLRRWKDRFPFTDLRWVGSRCVRGVCFQPSREFRACRLLSVPFLQRRVPGAAFHRPPDIEDPAIQGRRSQPPRRQLG